MQWTNGLLVIFPVSMPLHAIMSELYCILRALLMCLITAIADTVQAESPW